MYANQPRDFFRAANMKRERGIKSYKKKIILSFSEIFFLPLKSAHRFCLLFFQSLLQILGKIPILKQIIRAAGSRQQVSFFSENLYFRKKLVVSLPQNNSWVREFFGRKYFVSVVEKQINPCFSSVQ
jgi:uncharacterized membrane protein